MNDKTIVVVAGLGRCGSTLMMRCLDASGLPTHGNRVAFEDTRAATIQKDNGGWIKEAEGKAIKILDLHRLNLPDGFDYKIIWMKRSAKQQAKSMLKFYNALMKANIPTSTYRKAMGVIPKDTDKALRKFTENKIPCMIVNFEDILLKPGDILDHLQKFLDVKLDKEKFISIIKRRHTNCLPDISIETSYAKLYKEVQV